MKILGRKASRCKEMVRELQRASTRLRQVRRASTYVDANRDRMLFQHSRHFLVILFVSFFYKNRNKLSEETRIPSQYLSLIVTLDQRFGLIYRRKHN